MKRPRPPRADSFSGRAERRRRVTIVLLIVGLGSGAAAFYAERQIARQSTHRVTPGTIAGAHAHNSNGVWHLNLEFSYRVAGKSYVSRESRLLRDDFKDEREALSSDRSLAPGSEVQVHYDPAHPGRGYLEPRAHGLGFFTKSAMLWVCVALFWFIYDRNQVSRQTAAHR